MLIFIGLLLSFFTFSLVNFKYITLLLMLEGVNILVLLSVNLESFYLGSNVGFLLYMVVVTVEVTISLVALTRLWDFDSLYY